MADNIILEVRSHLSDIKAGTGAWHELVSKGVHFSTPHNVRKLLYGRLVDNVKFLADFAHYFEHENSHSIRSAVSPLGKNVLGLRDLFLHDESKRDEILRILEDMKRNIAELEKLI
ncbi:hypothetical protein K9L97_02630 [Candidatus Woesearchaeota archaeon]|nr:hypothetical protein [Candidatus Woesearchaeota archaeon]